MKTPPCAPIAARFTFAVLALLPAVGDSHAQLGKPTYTSPAPAKSEPKPVKHDAGKDKPVAYEKPAKQNSELGVSGGTICHVDPDRCPGDHLPAKQKKVAP